ncbi:glycosyl hydrolase 108 family protein [Asaia bogorensis]|uniref:glycosyl hydrolase 108 family protein n=1 Tax=Asaia bogorensis TaxID=91915 RepID=UPI00301B34D1
MRTNFPLIAQFTASYEGNYQASPNDAGNWTSGQLRIGRLVGTMHGISAPLMVQWCGDAKLVTAETMKSISIATYRAIYSALYWRPVAGDDLPGGVDLMLADFCFNSGVRRASNQLQQIIGMSSDEIDGNIGPETLAALAVVKPEMLAPWVRGIYAERFQKDLGVAVDGKIGPATLRAAVQQDVVTRMVVYALASRQEAAYRSFETFRIFGKGWLARLEARLARSLELLEPQRATA